MSNVSYCRFQNTLSDLRDCEEHIYSRHLSEDEKRARNSLVRLCLEITAQYQEETGVEDCYELFDSDVDAYFKSLPDLGEDNAEDE